jgi:hypothetical protein
MEHEYKWHRYELCCWCDNSNELDQHEWWYSDIVCEMDELYGMCGWDRMYM